MPIGIFTNTLFGFLSTISYKQWFLYLCIPHGALYQTTGDGLNMVCLNRFCHITNYTLVAFMTIFITDISYINLELLLCHLGSFFDKEATVWTNLNLHYIHVDQDSWIVITQTVSFKDWSLYFSMLVFALLRMSNSRLKTAISINFTAIIAGCSIQFVVLYIKLLTIDTFGRILK